ncbi:MAG: hypothetical protein ACRYF9_22045 [Janthinobacterium lividum]
MDNLRKAGTSSIPITRRLIEALRTENDQDVLTRRLASEVALSVVVERGLLLGRVLQAGSRELNASSISNAVTATDKDQHILNQNQASLKQELDLRNSLAGSAAKQIIERSRDRSESNRAVLQGDPILLGPYRLTTVDPNTNSLVPACSKMKVRQHLSGQIFNHCADVALTPTQVQVNMLSTSVTKRLQFGDQSFGAGLHAKVKTLRGSLGIGLQVQVDESDVGLITGDLTPHCYALVVVLRCGR